MTWLTDGKIGQVLMVFSTIVLAGHGVADADFIFGTPENLGPTVNSSSPDGAPSISGDGLSLYFASLRDGQANIWVTTRESSNHDWGEPVKLGPAVNSPAWDSELSISADSLELYFASDRSGGYGGMDLWVTMRPTISDPWEEGVNLGPTVNSSADDTDVCISADGLSLYVESYRAGGHGGNDLWVTKRATTSDPWPELLNLGPTVNGSMSEGAPSISADGLALLFSDHPNPRPGGHGGTDLWMMRRATTSDAWGEPVNLGPTVNGSGNDQGPSISTDGSTLYFFSRRSGGHGDFDIWQAPIIPIVDFNGDGAIDLVDMVVLVDRWGTDDKLCAIGPMSWGDGTVDIEDLKVFMTHWEKERGRGK